MKRIIALILILAMAAVMLVGCGGASGKAVKTGMAVISSLEKSKDAGEKDGLGQVDSVVVAVMVDDAGKILNCKIDTAQTKINFSAEGKIVTPLDQAFKTKQELGLDYGMAKVSTIKKDWFEQANAFAAYVIGKTAAEVKGIAVNEEAVPTVAELTSSVTIGIDSYVAAIEKAVNNAQSIGAKAGDKLGLGIVTSIAKSVDVTAEKPGLAQAYSNYSVATFGADGKITSCIIDASQSNVNFDAAGKITSDLKAELKTKNELGEAYGMLKASAIKKEWNEQAAAFAAYAVGKTAAEVKGVALNEEGAPTAAELTSSVTVHVSDFLTIIEKAAANAK